MFFSNSDENLLCGECRPTDTITTDISRRTHCQPVLGRTLHVVRTCNNSRVSLCFMTSCEYWFVVVFSVTSMTFRKKSSLRFSIVRNQPEVSDPLDVVLEYRARIFALISVDFLGRALILLSELKRVPSSRQIIPLTGKPGTTTTSGSVTVEASAPRKRDS